MGATCRLINAMRLTDFQRQAIKRTFSDVFGEGAVILFGSRIDDSKRGGDIDLFLEVQNHQDLFHKKVRFLARLKRQIGEQKIDVVFNEDSQRLIEQEARRWGIRL